MDHAVLLQVVHALEGKHALMPLPRLIVLSRVSFPAVTHFGDLDAPVEQALGVQAAFVLSDMFQ